MRRSRGLLMAVLGLACFALAGALLLSDVVEHDTSEALGFLPLILGAFLTVEGLLAFWRERRLSDRHG